MQSSLVSFLHNIAPGNTALSSGVSQSSSAPPFSGLMKNAISSLQSLEDAASATVEGLIQGSGVDIHQAMIATQKANLAFEMALAVRNKAVGAYQQLMQTQF